jgi:hypothetical protein
MGDCTEEGEFDKLSKNRPLGLQAVVQTSRHVERELFACRKRPGDLPSRGEEQWAALFALFHTT